MRAIVLLSTSLIACGTAQTVELTGQFVMSGFQGDWCGSMNPDKIRLDCPFDLGIYLLDVSNDAGPGTVVKSVCVHLEASANRTWATLPEALNATGKATLDRIPQGTFRLEIAGVEPPGGNCDHDAAVTSASLYGRSEPVALMGTEVVKRIVVPTKCKKAFTPTATCIP